MVIMATADLLFDRSTFHYPEYPGGLYQLVEEASISSFVLLFEPVNNNVKLTGEQLRECWSHALHQEYRKALSNKINMTRDNLQYVDELLSRGIKQVRILVLISRFELVTDVVIY
jgi:hypothetical protein